MATVKRYYWMKLKESFMTSDTIDYFMSQPDGANYVVLYQMLCLKTINTDGRLSRQIGEVIIPYDIPKIQRDLKWFSTDTIRVALELFKAVGLVYEDVDGVLTLTDHKNLVGSETNWAQQKRNQKLNASEPAPLLGGHAVESGVENFHPDIEIDIRDKRLDKDIKSLEEDYVGAEPQMAEPPKGAPAPNPEPPKDDPVLEIILNDKTLYPIYQDDINFWTGCYPAVNVVQELQKMKGWCDANPSKRKTSKGVRKFINNWLAKEQDKGGSRQNTYQAASTRPSGATGAAGEHEKAAVQRLQMMKQQRGMDNE